MVARTRSSRSCKTTNCDSGCESETTSSDRSVNTALFAVTHPSPPDKEQQRRSATTTTTTDQIVFADDLDALRELISDKVQLAVWRRERVPDFVTKLSDPFIDPASLPTFEGVVTPDICHQVLSTYMCCPYNLRSKKGNPLSDDCLEELVYEIDRLVHAFSEVSGSDIVNIKLEALSDNGCRFWHQDSVPLRLVATYRGPCTEYVAPEHSRSTLRKRTRNSTHAQTLTHHDVALFKGQGETDEETPILGQDGIVHRSPRIEGEGIYRLVLVLDIPQEGWHY